MILTVDIGNSNIVMGGVEGDEIVFEARLRTDSTKTSDEYCVDLKSILDVYKIEVASIEGAIIGSVVPQVLNSFQTAIKKLIGKQSLAAGANIGAAAVAGGALAAYSARRTANERAASK